jgi:hypothetical protein
MEKVTATLYLSDALGLNRIGELCWDRVSQELHRPSLEPNGYGQFTPAAAYNIGTQLGRRYVVSHALIRQVGQIVAGKPLPSLPSDLPKLNLFPNFIHCHFIPWLVGVFKHGADLIHNRFTIFFRHIKGAGCPGDLSLKSCSRAGAPHWMIWNDLCGDQTTGLIAARGNYWLLLCRMLKCDWIKQGVCKHCAGAWHEAIDKHLDHVLEKILEWSKDPEQAVRMTKIMGGDILLNNLRNL